MGQRMTMHLFFRYKCPLRNYDTWLLKKMCRWRGDMEDYIIHVKNYHPENFFKIQKCGKFKWKLPNHGDQQDIGIIKDKSDYYVYEMFYSNASGKLNFSLTCLSGEPASSNYYVFYLENATENTIQYLAPIGNINEIAIPIEERTSSIRLYKSEVKKCLLFYGHFTWKLILM